MRRAMLTAGVAATPITVGPDTPGTANAGLVGAYSIWTDDSPASGTGTITNFKVDIGTAGNIAPLTISPAGVIRAIGSTVAVSVGINNLSVSLAIQAGDYIGAWCQGATPGIRFKSGGTTYYVSTAGATGGSTKPAAGNTLSPTTYPAKLAILGTGTQ